MIDSLLFVFGFRAQKIRTKKLSVLIHNSEQHPGIQSCSVRIHFRKIRAPLDPASSDEPFEVIPGSEFTVARTARKDNTSDYYIDERRVQYKEVGTLLRECGVDLDHNRFLILQGEVESISLLKPKAAAQDANDEGLLEYLEDIIGTIRYKPMLEEVATDIDKTNEIRAEKANRVQNLQRDKSGLEGPKNEALGYLRLENELIEAKNLYYQLRTRSLGDQIGERREACSAAKSELEQLDARLVTLGEQLETTAAEFAAHKKEHEKRERHCDKVKRKLDELEKEECESAQAVKHGTEQIKKITRSLETETAKLADLRLVPERNERRCGELESERGELEARLEPAEKRLHELMGSVNEATRACQQRKDALTDRLAQLQASANKAKADMDVAKNALDVLMSAQTYETRRLAETREKLAEAERVGEQKRAELKVSILIKL